MKRFLFLCSLFFFLCVRPAYGEADIHVIEKGETAMQIAIDHNLSMDQLQQLNPNADLEMLMVDDQLTLPPDGVSFEDFLTEFYAGLIQISDLHCENAADGSAFCFLQAKNVSAQILYNIKLSTTAKDSTGGMVKAETSIPLLQLLPDESLPVFANIEGLFSAPIEATAFVSHVAYNEAAKGSFRVDTQHYERNDRLLPDRSGTKISFTFDDETCTASEGKMINLLAGAYDEAGSLIGVRSLYGDFYQELEVSLYTIGGTLSNTKTWVEVY